MFRYTDGWLNVQYPLLGGSTSDTSANNIRKPVLFTKMIANECLYDQNDQRAMERATWREKETA